MKKHFIFIRILNRLSGILDKYHYLDYIGEFLNNYRHECVYNNINKYLLNSLNYIKALPNNESQKFSNIIWVFWLQGPQAMPFIVQRCIKSIQLNSNNAKVILINKNNLSKYSTLPIYIYKKVKRGDISFTEYSDILRYNLLSHYGGLWLDPTNYCTGTIDIKYFHNNHILITSGCPDKYHFYICNKWAESLIGGYKNNPLFIFMNKFFELYWKDNNSLINYNLVDYALYFAYQHNVGDFAYYVDNMSKYNNPDMFKLMPYINHKYNPDIYKNLTKKTHIFKLTYKSKFLRNPNTFYSKLIK